MNPLGLYIHIPFCVSKCGYCDFYSFAADRTTMDMYTDAVCRQLDDLAKKSGRTANTLYFGGGTPSLLGGKSIEKIVDTAKRCFGLQNAEITLEANPSEDLFETFKIAYESGVNRLSIGVQSGDENELKLLTRRHSLLDVKRTVEYAKQIGIQNVSLDLMIGVPGQTKESLESSIDYLTGLEPAHISAYILKVEEGTPFSKMSLILPDDDYVSDLYLRAVELLENRGYLQYEISNFSKKGYESRHNLKYWNCEEYIGIGPSAHSFLNGKRFYYDRDFDGYIKNPSPILDGEGGSAEEYAMLRLRLREGIVFSEFETRYLRKPDSEFINQAEKLKSTGLLNYNGEQLSLTPKGFLVSNQVITRLLAQGI